MNTVSLLTFLTEPIVALELFALVLCIIFMARLSLSQLVISNSSSTAGESAARTLYSNFQPSVCSLFRVGSTISMHRKF